MPFDAASYIMGKNASGGGGSTITVEPLSVTENGTYTAPAGKAYAPVTVNVPNSYSASDEGKVVDNGELVAQTSLTVTQNGTVNTTLNNEVVVNVPTGGGGGVASNDVNFIDYDGTIVYSYSAADFANLSALPANPSHSGLTAQGWNCTLADAKEYVASYGFLDVGQNYTTSNGETRIYGSFETGRTNPYIGIAVNGTVTLYNKETLIGTLTGTSITTVKTIRHDFGAGEFVLRIVPNENTTYSFVGGSTYSRVFNRSINGQKTGSECYWSTIKHIELGAGASLGSYAFHSLYSLKSVTIPTGISISQNAFYYCYNLKFITLPKGASLTSSEFAYCSTLETVSIPAYETTGSIAIASSMFNTCHSLKRVCVPFLRDTISQTAFSSCSSLTRLVVPSNISTISSKAFQNCTGLGIVRFTANTAPTVSASDALSGWSTDCLIFVPYAGLASYLTATNYPSPATFTYLSFATYASGATLPTQDTTSAYNVTWYATKEDAIAGTNPITQGNGSEVYCTYAAV